MAVTANDEAADAVTAGPLSTWLISKPDQASMTSVLILHGPCQSESASRWPEESELKGSEWCSTLGWFMQADWPRCVIVRGAMHGLKPACEP